MRKVIVYKNELDRNINSYRRIQMCTGLFHKFGMIMEEDERGFTNASAAIVELEDGTVITPLANMIKFVKDHDKE